MEHVSGPLKYLAVTASAFVATLLCFLLMQTLIATGTGPLTETDPPDISAPLLPPMQPEEMREVRTRANRIVPAQLPPAPDGVSIAPEEVIVTVHAERPTFGSIADFLDSDAMDFEIYPPLSDLVPLYVVQPVYPFAAAMKGVEGFVLVNFSVRENGTVLNPVVVASEPGELFDDAALSAVGKFRFQPRTVGGDAVIAPDLQIKFLFRLETAAAGSPRPSIQSTLAVDGTTELN
ncbi:MAG: energy transducer TonB [Pseudomonadales bacterium]